MRLKRVVFVGLLAFAGLALASHDVQPTAGKTVSPPPRGEGDTGAKVRTGGLDGRATAARADDGADPQALRPRRALPKTPTVELQVPDNPTGRLVIKFVDDVTARAKPDGTLETFASPNLAEAREVCDNFELRVRPALTLSEDKLAGLQARAADLSGYAQPHLGNMLIIEGGGESLLAAAQALNELDTVEFVYCEPEYIVYQPATGACCLPDANCQDGLTFDQCSDAGGTYQGDASACDADGVCGACCKAGDVCEDSIQTLCVLPDEYQGDGTLCANTDCSQADEPDCGEPGTGDCFEINGDLFCADVCDGTVCTGCCEDVCAVDPFCCEEDATWPGRGAPTWDAWCVEHAFSICGGGIPDNICQSSTNGPCFETHPEAGCSDEGCCLEVCSVESTCCEFEWDALCVELAIDICTPTGGCILPGPTCVVLTEAECTAQGGVYLGDGTTCAGGLTPNFTPAQGYLTAGSYVQENGSIPPEIIPGVKFDVDGILLPGYEGQGYDLQRLWEIGDLLAAPPPQGGNIGPNRTRGLGIRIGIVEHSAFVETAIGPAAPYRHEDLHGKVIPEPGQTPIIIPGSQNMTGNHGTACLGIAGAIDHDASGNEVEEGLSPDQSLAEEVGIVGVAPEAELYFFPIVSVEEPGGRLLDAIANALDIFGPGDVLSFSIGPGFGTLASNEGPWLMLRLAADLGVTCCLAAGNDCFDLAGNPQAGDPSGGDARVDCDAIIVGACYPGRGPGNVHCRLGFSNFCRGPECADEAAVHVAAWGTSVATLGYGGMFRPGGDLNRSYTNTFGGTSAAAPQVAGLVACLQGLAKQFFGIPVMPDQIRFIVSNNGWNQCGFRDPEDLPGNDDPLPCGGDWDFDQPPNRIGGTTGETLSYSDPFTAGEALISSGIFDGSPLIDGITILRGNLLFGNRSSIRASENNYLVIGSQFTTPSSKPNSSSAPTTPQYVAYGQITDLLVEAHADVPDVNAMLVSVESHVSGGTGLMFVEMYDWQIKRWIFAGFTLLGLADPPDQDPPQPIPAFPIGEAARFVRPSDDRVLIRIWTLSVGGSFGGGIGQVEGTEYRTFHDLVDLAVGEDFGDIFDIP
ncbi:MAG: S8 family serine peptidase [Planctomycetota bacterium]|jgi:subtilisin family serine protease